ncbi:carbon-nitrogen hydrolase family protein [Nocardia camponoti]|uniref:Hydrolase n=1 Tax=Nocardia camponoti TaxID=1616106 RepID=A0A917QFS9_9NOCA|nr:carbon-nitrogen hydrolase family protein [Nocardia camponoti]GGK46958.1 hydrolase [Nocardia camponoti]
MQLADSHTHRDATNAKVPVAVVQFAPTTDPQANIGLLREHVRTAHEQGARVVVAPEYSMFAVTELDARVLAVAEPLDGPFARGLSSIATEFGVFLVAGMVEQPTPDANRISNTLVAVDPSGAQVAVYRKVHLYDAFGQTESELVQPGPLVAPALFDVDGVIFGLQTCFDLRFPEGIRRVALAGAQVLVLPAQWIPGPGKADQWTTLLRARAIENTVYVAAADQCTPLGTGLSMIIDPAGQILVELGVEPGVLTAPIDAARLAQVRSTNPSLSLGRFAIVDGQ